MGVTLDATNAQIVNAVASEMVMFGGRIPETTAANIREVGNLIISRQHAIEHDACLLFQGFVGI